MPRFFARNRSQQQDTGDGGGVGETLLVGVLLVVFLLVVGGLIYVVLAG